MAHSSDLRPILVWYRNDLRIEDHPALMAASGQNVPVIPVYILDESVSEHRRPGGASKWWLEGSLSELATQLRAKGSQLVLKRGKACLVLAQLAADTNAQSVYFSRCYEQDVTEEENDIISDLKSRSVDCRQFRGSLLFEPEEIKTKSGTPFKVFTPFYRACMTRGEIKSPLPAPKFLMAPKDWPTSDGLQAWKLRPSAPDWAEGLAHQWSPGLTAARDRLDAFLDAPVATYVNDRDRPEVHGTSTLSPYLRFGEISPRQVWYRARFASQQFDGKGTGAAAFMRQLIWREFSYHLLTHWPKIVNEPFNPRFTTFPWGEDSAALIAWQTGRTGYPIVDAGMRQLWQTGWMHNRVRMVVASFLTKHLRIHWRQGADWFWDTLVDADLANNTAGWQWVAGCGADASPYFRVFNPILQGQKFDPDGAYVRKWVPELADVPKKFIHNPWENPSPIADYPPPIVDHKNARKMALEAYAEMA